MRVAAKSTVVGGMGPFRTQRTFESLDGAVLVFLRSAINRWHCATKKCRLSVHAHHESSCVMQPSLSLPAALTSCSPDRQVGDDKMVRRRPVQDPEIRTPWQFRQRSILSGIDCHEPLTIEKPDLRHSSAAGFANANPGARVCLYRRQMKHMAHRMGNRSRKWYQRQRVGLWPTEIALRFSPLIRLPLRCMAYTLNVRCTSIA